MTIVEFILARVADDEEAARFCAAGVGARWHIVESGQTMIEDETGSEVIHYDGARNQSDVDHIARHDPARVLAECAALRRIAEIHAPTFEDFKSGRRWYCTECDPDLVGSPDEGCPTLRSLAAIWAGHESYDPEWRTG